MESKIKMNFIDVTSITNTYCNPRKSWHELLMSLNSIYKNFKKSQIDPKELIELIETSEQTNGVPDIVSIEVLMEAIKRYIEEYKIDDSNTLFLEFKRHAAIYLFAIGSQEKSLDILKEILSSINTKIESTTDNLDINLVCIKDIVKLNQATINFWLENFDESRMLIEEVITYYEGTNDELYLIKMVSFISVAFTYLAWIYTKKGEFDNAEKAFLHSLKVIKSVKTHTREGKTEGSFINIKAKKIFVYDQLINFYAHKNEFHNCKNPLNEILKIMDKDNFFYDVDIGPINHCYFYITGIFYAIKFTTKIDLNKILHYLVNIMGIMFKNQDAFEVIPPIFYQQLFDVMQLIKENKSRTIFDKAEKTNGMSDHELELRRHITDKLDKIADYIDEIIGKYDFEKAFTVNPQSGGSSMMDSIVSLDRYKKYIRNKTFAVFNHLTNTQDRCSEAVLKNGYEQTKFQINEIYTIKLACDRVLQKYGNIMKDLVDCKHVEEKIILEGLNGYMIIENDDLVLYVVYKFIARDGSHILYDDVKLSSNEDNKENVGSHGNKLESFKVIQVKLYDPKFAPLYYRRFYFKLLKDAKTFNFSIYFALINTLYSLKLYYPCISLISLFIEDISRSVKDLYIRSKTSKRILCYLHLFEFLLFLQVYLLITLKNFDRALYELLRISTPINEYNTLLYKILLGLCLAQCSYFDLAIFTLSDAAHMIRPLLDANKEEEENEKKKEFMKPEDSKNDKSKKKTQEAYVNEMRMFHSIIQCFMIEIFRLMKRIRESNFNLKICFRCKLEDSGITAVCLDCKRAIYCNRKCLKKNTKIHGIICKIYLEKNSAIKAVFEQMQLNFEEYESQVKRAHEKKIREFGGI